MSTCLATLWCLAELPQSDYQGAPLLSPSPDQRFTPKTTGINHLQAGCMEATVNLTGFACEAYVVIVLVILK